MDAEQRQLLPRRPVDRPVDEPNPKHAHASGPADGDKLGWDGAHFIVNAPVPLLPTMLYGRYAVRFKADPVPGYKTAWLLWPDSGNWPADGEIDFPENSLDGNACAFVHHLGATIPSDQDA